MKLNYKRVMLVGFAFLIIQVFWMAYDAIVPLILVNKFGMNQTWSGLIMALDNILAVVLLPVFGSLSDKSNHKRGKRTPFIFVGTVLAVIAFFGLSFVDYAQINKLGEGAQAPGYYQATDESIAAQESFWDENYYIINNESQRYSDSVAAHNGMMDKENDEGEIYLKDYVAKNLVRASTSKSAQSRRNTLEKMESFRPRPVHGVLLAVLLVWAVLSFSSEATFIYSNF